MTPIAVETPEISSGDTSSRAVQKIGVPVRLAFFFWVAIFTGAFLLFFAQLLLGKLILPMFGGAPAVWTSCLLVFQVLLLIGYALAHGIASRLTIGSQGKIIPALLGFSLALLGLLSHVWSTPITPGFEWRTGVIGNPSLTIIRFLVAAIGFPFLLLSTTSPLLQHWWNKIFGGASPYRLYAVSNAGSLIGLLSYPFLIEPALRLSAQAWVWTCGYLAYAICFGICGWWTAKTKEDSGHEMEPAERERDQDDIRPLGWQRPALWMALAACASIQLLATTNFICQEVAVIPFFWVLPLSIYLASFILTFESGRWYSRGVFHTLFVGAVGWVIALSLPGTTHSYLAQLSAACGLLFVGCMICHGEAARQRPSPERLTHFYLCISLGGAAGGTFVSLIAPRIFPGYWEFPLGILGCAVLLLVATARDRESWWYVGRNGVAVAIAAGVVLLGVPELAVVWKPANSVPTWVLMCAGLGLICVAAILWHRKREAIGSPGSVLWLRGAVAAAFVVLIVGLVLPQRWLYSHVLARARNFYGMVRVVDVQPDNYLVLVHGVTAHGFQSKRPGMERVATGYYGPNSGVDVLLSGWPKTPLRVGLVGMGAGTLATLGRPGDTYRFYEINPQVVRFSMGPQAYFTFINDSAAHVEVVMGDARMSLEQEVAKGELQRFDVLVLDAFSSDAIPVHLLTREAFRIYRQHLNGPHSVIAIHITNAALDLGPVVAGIAQENEYYSVRTNPVWLSGMSSRSDWILLSRDPGAISSAALRQISVPFPGKAKPILWTDEYSNLLQVLR
jgi:spermidine synthase